MKIVTAKEMQALDKKTIEEFGLPSLVLMERASLGVVNVLEANEANVLTSKGSCLILVGTGNNGADGLVVARLLHAKGKTVTVLTLGEEAKRTKENSLQMELINKLEIPNYSYSADIFDTLEKESDLIIDAIFGVGLSRNVAGLYQDCIERVNNSEKLKIAVDIPSGLDADTGEVLGVALKVSYTVTFAFYKTGLLMDQALEYVGKVTVIDIGIPAMYAKALKINYVNKDLIKSLFLAKRSLSSFKNHFGRVLLIGGSKNMSGAIVLATKSALKSGAGLVEVMVDEEIHKIVAMQVPTAMVSNYSKEHLINNLNNYDTIVVGPGLGQSLKIIEIITYLLLHYEKTIVFDADAINLLAKDTNLLNNTKAKVILTPHIGEMSRLLKVTTKEIQLDRLKAVNDFISEFPKTTLILKGAKSIIANEHEIYINSTGNPILARGGSGDILSGLIGGLACQKLEPLRSAILGVYLHGLAGDLALKDFNEHSIITEELIDYISDAFKTVE